MIILKVLILFARLIRVKNWIKNFSLLLPVFFAGQLLAMDAFEIKLLIFSFSSFCLSSSIIYIINDIVDLENDKIHPIKKFRPIANNEIKIKNSLLVAFVLTILNFILLFFLPWPIILVITSYLVINLFYCFGLKNIAIIDITIISLGFILRLLAGSLAANVILSHWIIILTFLLMFSVALAKRRDDLILSKLNQNNSYRISQGGYSLAYIDIAKSISFSVTLVAYIIYSVSEDVTQRMGTNFLYITSLPVFLGIMRYLQLSIVYKKTGSPIDLLLKDTFLIFTLLTWFLIFFFILYV